MLQEGLRVVNLPGASTLVSSLVKKSLDILVPLNVGLPAVVFIPMVS
jgi:hypothetical protein